VILGKSFCISGFLSFFLKFVRCTPLINIFGSKSRTHTQQNSRLYFSSTSFAHFV